MNEGFDKLIEIGAQRIHERTHIAKAHIQAILDENFENLNSIQFLGFISILQREYNIDLSELKHDGMMYFNSKVPEVKVDSTVKVFVPRKNKVNKNLIYLIAAVFIIVFFSILSSSSEESDAVIIDNSAINAAHGTLSQVAVNTANEEQIKEEEAIKVQEQEKEAATFKIIPASEVWIGYINLNTYDKKQSTITDEFVLDPTQNWLIALGHGQISIEVNGEVQTFSTSRTIRFSYINGVLKKIRLDEFKRLNRGGTW